jgi:hypothetical protein
MAMAIIKITRAPKRRTLEILDVSTVSVMIVSI